MCYAVDYTCFFADYDIFAHLPLLYHGTKITEITEEFRFQKHEESIIVSTFFMYIQINFRYTLFFDMLYCT